MVFKDYYAILEIDPTSSQEDIKRAYRKASLRWHPDRNPDVDTTSQMKDVNEAYSILKDPVTRERYDEEYRRFKSFNGDSKSSNNWGGNANRAAGKDRHRTDYTQSAHERWDYDYTVHDSNLDNDIKKARENAERLVREFMEALKKDSKTAAQGAWEASRGYVILMIIGLFVSLLVLCFR